MNMALRLCEVMSVAICDSKCIQSFALELFLLARKLGQAVASQDP